MENCAVEAGHKNDCTSASVYSLNVEFAVQNGTPTDLDIDPDCFALETVLTLADVMGSAHRDGVESMAASLPAAPRCPF